jgi:hypothetical protein
MSCLLQCCPDPEPDAKSRIGWDHFSQIVRSEDFRLALRSPDPELSFSFSDLQNIHPDRLLWLLLAGEHLRSKGKKVSLVLPDHPGKLQFLRSSHFLALAEDLFAFSNRSVLDTLPVFSPEPETCYCSEFRRVEIGSAMCLDLAVFHEWIQDWICRCSASIEFWNMLSALAQLVVEIGRNIVFHSRYGDGWGYSVLTIERGAAPPRLSCTIADTGRGFRRSLLAKGCAVPNDMEAIKRAVLFRCEKAGECGGLFMAIQLAGCLSGTVRIRSGSAFASLELKGRPVLTRDGARQFLESGLEINCEKGYFPGVQFYVGLNGRTSGKVRGK